MIYFVAKVKEKTMLNKKTWTIAVLFMVIIGSVALYAQVRPENGVYGLTNSNLTIELRGSNITFRDGTTFLGSGTFRIEGNILIYSLTNPREAGDMLIVSATRLEDSRGLWLKIR
jgi:hypothetical protein